MKLRFTMAMAVLIFGSSLGPAQPAGPTRTDLQRHDLSVPGREVVQVIVGLDPGVMAPRHTHPGEEVGYILAGTVRMMIEGRETLTLGAGDGFLIPPGTPHNALDVGPGTGRMLSTYLVETGQPVATLIDHPSGLAPRPLNPVAHRLAGALACRRS